MKLQDAINSVSNGDILFVFAEPFSSKLGKFISEWQGEHAPYHCGILVWQIEGGSPSLMVCQMDPEGNNIVPLTHFQNNHTHILKKPDSVKIDGDALLQTVHTIKYSMLGAAISGLSQYLRFIPFVGNQQRKFCSQYVADVYNAAGFTPKIPNKLNPKQLRDYFLLHGHKEIVIDG